MLGISHRSPLITSEGAIFLGIATIAGDRTSEDRELLGSRIRLLRGRVVESETGRPLTIGNSDDTDLPAGRKVPLDSADGGCILATGRPILDIDRELDHREAPVQQIVAKTIRLTSLRFRLHREVEHHKTPHRIVGHESHSERIGPDHTGGMRR